MMINEKLRTSLIKRLISSAILGRWITQDAWYRLCLAQHHKGLLKYGHTIDCCDKDQLDWEIESIQEIIDFWIYRSKMRE